MTVLDPNNDTRTLFILMLLIIVIRYPFCYSPLVNDASAPAFAAAAAAAALTFPFHNDKKVPRPAPTRTNTHGTRTSTATAGSHQTGLADNNVRFKPQSANTAVSQQQQQSNTFPSVTVGAAAKWTVG